MALDFGEGKALIAARIPGPVREGVFSADRLAARWGSWAVLVYAACYYALYFENGLNLGGEGGTTAVIAMRMLEGQRPIADTFLGYNVLWFWPVAGLFAVVGPNYLAMRAFFFVLCAAASVLGFLTVRKVVGSGLLALVAGIVLALIPGMLFRNYMGLLPVAAGLAFVSAFLVPPATRRGRIFGWVAAGAVLGLVFLVRIEVGYPLFVIWAGLVFLGLFAPGAKFAARCKEALLAAVWGAMGFCAVHIPFVADAHARGYSAQFYGQYSAIPGMLLWELKKAIPANSAHTEPPKEAAGPLPPEGVAAASEPAKMVPAAGAGGDGRRERPPAQDAIFAKKSKDRYFAAAIYFPVGASAVLVVAGGAVAVIGLARRNARDWSEGMCVVVLTGCALSLFPQYFFFRPDTPHISEFMVPFQVAVFCAAGLAVRRAAEFPKAAIWSAAVVAAGLLAITEWVHFGHAWPKESAGTIAARKNGPELFVGLNGVRARLKPDRAAACRGLLEAILSNSAAGDYILVLPYSPTIHLMADRPSYLWDLYTDNTMAGGEFDELRIREIEKFRPPVVVIDHRDINNSEESRLPNWAPRLYAYLSEHYLAAGKFLTNEVFVKKPDAR